MLSLGTAVLVECSSSAHLLFVLKPNLIVLVILGEIFFVDDNRWRSFRWISRIDGFLAACATH